MQRNRRIPLKIHYFFLFGAMSTISPFTMVIVRQLGIPVVTQGYIAFLSLLINSIVKPFIGAAADAFPKARKIIFICVLMSMYLGMSAICLIPPMYKQVVIEGQFRQEYFKYELMDENDDKLILSSNKSGECYVSEAWDCMIPCNINEKLSTMEIKRLLLKEKPQPVVWMNFSTSDLVYTLPTSNQTRCDPYQQLKFECQGGRFVGADCPSLFSVGFFWVYVILFIAAQVSFSTSISITDAICLDSIGENGDYGVQRAWGTVGWGLMAPISGLLIDWWSGDTYSKDYAPIIVVVMGVGILDIIISLTKLKVPKINSGGNIWSSVGHVLKKPHVVLFLIFVILNGLFDGIILYYVFVLQEEMAEGTVYMKYLSFIQGATLATQCLFEAPFMWIFSWFYKRMGAVNITKAVFFLYVIRLLLLGLVGSFGPVWTILICELLNGPCYGLGFTAIVVQAGNLTPPGTSATFQSIVNIAYESLGYGLSNLLGGIIFQQIGAAGIYYVFSVIAGVNFIAYLISSKFMSQLNFKPKQDVVSSGKSDATYTDIPVSHVHNKKEDENKFQHVEERIENIVRNTNE